MSTNPHTFVEVVDEAGRRLKVLAYPGVKAVVRYHSAEFLWEDQDPVGNRCLMMVADHPAWRGEVPSEGIDALTGPVVSYDETLGIIETDNTVYVPN